MSYVHSVSRFWFSLICFNKYVIIYLLNTNLHTFTPQNWFNLLHFPATGKQHCHQCHHVLND